MALSNVIIDDYLTERRYSFLITDDVFAKVRNSWNDETWLLKLVNGKNMFTSGCRLSDLTITQFRVLLSMFFITGEYDAAEQTKFDNNVIVSAKFFTILASMINHIEITMNGAVDTLNIVRVNKTTITTKCSLTWIPAGEIHQADTGLKIVVDNTNE